MSPTASSPPSLHNVCAGLRAKLARRESPLEFLIVAVFQALSGFSFLVDSGLGDFSEGPVGSLLLIESFLKKWNCRI